MTTSTPPALGHLRTRWAAIGAAVAVTLGAAGIGSYNIASADIDEGDRPVFVAVTPCRLLDTRPGAPNAGPQDGPLGPDQTLTVTAHGENGRCTGAAAIPTDAVALSLNVTALNQTERTFLTVWDEGDDPGTSNLNPEPGQPPTPNAVNTPLSPAGTFNIRNNAGDVNVIADVVGYYANHNHDDRYITDSQLDDTVTARVDAAVEAAVDAAIADIEPAAAIYPDRLFIAAPAFSRTTSDSINLTVNSGRLEFAPGLTRCFVTEVPAPPSTRQFVSIEVLYEQSANEADIIVDVHRPRSTVGDTAGAALIQSEAPTLSGVAPADRGQLGSETIVIPGSPDLNPNEPYTVLLCSSSDLTVSGIAVNTTG